MKYIFLFKMLLVTHINYWQLRNNLNISLYPRNKFLADKHLRKLNLKRFKRFWGQYSHFRLLILNEKLMITFWFLINDIQI